MDAVCKFRGSWEAKGKLACRLLVDYRLFGVPWLVRTLRGVFVDATDVENPPSREDRVSFLAGLRDHLRMVLYNEEYKVQPTILQAFLDPEQGWPSDLPLQAADFLQPSDIEPAHVRGFLRGTTAEWTPSWRTPLPIGFKLDPVRLAELIRAVRGAGPALHDYYLLVFGDPVSWIDYPVGKVALLLAHSGMSYSALADLIYGEEDLSDDEVHFNPVALIAEVDGREAFTIELAASVLVYCFADNFFICNNRVLCLRRIARLGTSWAQGCRSFYDDPSSLAAFMDHAADILEHVVLGGVVPVEWTHGFFYLMGLVLGSSTADRPLFRRSDVQAALFCSSAWLRARLRSYGDVRDLVLGHFVASGAIPVPGDLRIDRESYRFSRASALRSVGLADMHRPVEGEEKDRLVRILSSSFGSLGVKRLWETAK